MIEKPVRPWVRLEFMGAAADLGDLIATARPHSALLKHICVVSVRPIDENYANVTLIAEPSLVDEWQAAASDVEMKHITEFEIMKEAIAVLEERLLVPRPIMF